MEPLHARDQTLSLNQIKERNVRRNRDDSFET